MSHFYKFLDFGEHLCVKNLIIMFFYSLKSRMLIKANNLTDVEYTLALQKSTVKTCLTVTDKS